MNFEVLVVIRTNTNAITDRITVRIENMNKKISVMFPSFVNKLLIFAIVVPFGITWFSVEMAVRTADNKDKHDRITLT